MDMSFEDYSQDDYYEEKYADELEIMNELEELNGVHSEPAKLPKSQLREHLENPLSIYEGLAITKNGHVKNLNADKRKREFDPDVDLYLSEEEDDASAKGVPESTSKKGRYCNTEEPKEKLSTKRVFSIPPLGKDVVTITGTHGRRVFVCQQRKETDDQGDVSGKTCRLKMQLLSRPFKELKSQVEEVRRREAIDRAEALTANLQGPMDEDISLGSEARDQEHETDDKLWVEKYTPKSFQELLSDDGTNRTLLKWIKLWEPAVFGKGSVGQKEKKVIKKDLVSIGSKKGKFKKQWDHSDDLVLDPSGRPKYKIALLCGNPGLGKTTLAHVIGYHAGYNIVEMNASDDRSPEIFRNKIEDATQMKALIGEDKRPNCLVIDEIDGAPGPAINLLVQAAKDSQSNTKEGKKKSKLALNRPIICICNNQYVPALKQLRQNSLILNFPRTTPAKLVQRLLEISKKEEMRVDMATLFSLCDQSEHDIRSCINTLQFVRRKHKVLRMEHLQTIDVGVKDMKCGLFDFVRQVFQLPKSNKQASKMKSFGGSRFGSSFSNPTEVKQSSASVRFHHVLQLAYSVSENERMLQGIHDNFLLSRAKDPRLESMVSATEWLQFADTLNQMISSLQTFTLWKYFPFVPVAFHMMLSSPIGPRLNFQNSQIEFVMKKARITQTLGTVTQEVTPCVRKNLSEETAVTETVPYLFHIITPHLRPVNVQLYSDNEKSELRNLIEIMISYNLTYQQERSLDGQYSYLIEPHIEELITYPGIPLHKHLTYALKQMIAREIELEKMRRIEKFRVAEAAVARQTKEVTPSVVLSIEPKKLQKGKEKVTRDFFGRLVQPKPEAQPKSSGNKKTTDSLINTRVWFKFNEGFTNAVRRPIKVKELL